MRVDLHSHSTCSDGRLSPTQLVDLAAAHGVTHLALTDHDTVAGVAEARAASAGRLSVVAGIEITTGFHGRELHLLGLFVDLDSPDLQQFCEQARCERETRIERMVRALRAARYDVTMDDVLLQAAGGVLARPHLARALVAKGYVESTQRAFDQLLSPGHPGHVERPKPAFADAVKLVRSSGGVSSLAHPGVDKISRQELAALAELGLDAVEAAHPNHPPNQVEAYVRWGAACGLRWTGGSDFHAPGETDAHPGSFGAAPEEFERLAELSMHRGGVVDRGA